MSIPVKIDAIPDAQTKARLEFNYYNLHGETWMVCYELVLPLGEVDCRGTWDHKPALNVPKSHRQVYLTKSNCLRIPLGRTECTSSNPNYPHSAFDGQPDLPFRDGAHSGWDRDKLGLELYIITPKGIYHKPYQAKEAVA